MFLIYAYSQIKKEESGMRKNISIRHAVKKYGNRVIIPDLNLDVREGEFFTLLGPSGCGKTTLLRMIAGFNSIEGGDFYFNDTRINDMDPAKRNIGMVFQNYAIFPNLTVRKNVEFGLKNRKLPKNEIRETAEKFMALMHVDEYADRLPDRLSGGQQQRVALARALAITPDVLLTDEPLSNLDAKLRVEMRSVIKDIQNRVGITTVYVTHDQEEAMAVSDRIAVMKDGVIQHIGTPKNIYQRPANLFVATFIGRTNVISGKLVVEDGRTFILTKCGYRTEISGVKPEYRSNRDIKLSIRPEELRLSPYEGGGMEAEVKSCVFLGLNTHYFVTLSTGEDAEIIQESSIDSIIGKGTKIKLTINTEKVNLFTDDGEDNILEGVVNDNAPGAGEGR